MSKLWLNTAKDFLLLNVSNDWLLLDGATSSTFPTTPKPAEITVTSFSPTYVSVTHGLKRTARSRGAHAWQIEYRYSGMTRATFAPLQAFLTKQAGQYGTFTVSLPGLTNQGTGAGSPKVNGGSQTGTSLITDGWTAGSAVLKAGDWIQIDSDPKVYQVVADATADGSGNATLTIFPALRMSPANDATIATSVVFRCALSGDSMSVDWNHCVMPVGFSVSMVEV